MSHSLPLYKIARIPDFHTKFKKKKSRNKHWVYIGVAVPLQPYKELEGFVMCDDANHKVSSHWQNSECRGGLQVTVGSPGRACGRRSLCSPQWQEAQVSRIHHLFNRGSSVSASLYCMSCSIRKSGPGEAFCICSGKAVRKKSLGSLVWFFVDQ